MKIDQLSGQRADLLEKNQFYIFLEHLAKEIREAELTELEYELERIVSTYDALIDYFKLGVSDPERDRVYQQLVGRALLLSDRCAIAAHGAKELPYYTAQKKSVRREDSHAYLLQLEAFAEGTKKGYGADESNLLTFGRKAHGMLWWQLRWTNCCSRLSSYRTISAPSSVQ